MRQHPSVNRAVSDLLGAPVLRWAGSKKKLLPILVAATPKNIGTYVEAFAGSAVLSLRTPATSRVLNDLNSDLVDAYRTLRQRPVKLWAHLASLPDDEETYYRIRAQDPTELNKFDRAARFIYLNRFCFNGVYRTNRKGQFNVSRGSGNLGIPSKSTFVQFARHIKTADLLSEDFEAAAGRASRGDFLYLDPPYALGGKRDRGEYGCASFKEVDEARLVETMLKGSKRGAKILLSYSPSESVIGALRDWSVTYLEVARNVAGFAGGRRRATEVLISNYSWNTHASSSLV